MLTVTISGTSHELPVALTQGKALYGLACADRSDDLVVWDRQGKMDITIMWDDWFMPYEGMAMYVTKKADFENSGSPLPLEPAEVEIDGKPLPIEEISFGKYTGRELKTIIDLIPEDNELYVDIPGRPDWKLDDGMNLLLTDGLRLVSSALIEDIGHCSRQGKPPRLASRYRIIIDMVDIVVDRRELSGDDILALVNKKSSEWLLNRKFSSGARRAIRPEETIDLTHPNVERFETIPSTATLGGALKRRVQLTDSDAKFLDQHFPRRWETKVDPNVLIIRGFSLPAGYNHDKGDLLIRIPSGYPVSYLDMFCLSPMVQGAYGCRPAATAIVWVHGAQWQQWSRHYDRWNEENSVSNHLTFISSLLLNEAQVRR